MYSLLLDGGGKGAPPDVDRNGGNDGMQGGVVMLALAGGGVERRQRTLIGSGVVVLQTRLVGRTHFSGTARFQTFSAGRWTKTTRLACREVCEMRRVENL